MRRLVLALVLLCLGPPRAGAVVLDPAFTESLYAGAPELGGATAMAWAPDGSNRLFVTVKDGSVRIIQNAAVLPVPFVTIAPIYATSECGLLGVAFDPNFINNRHVYFFVTVSSTEQQIIRYTASGNTGVDKTVIVAGLPTLGINHDGGGLAVGPDDKLYWGIGDNGAALGVNEDLTRLTAKIGRANIDGTVPADNPFADGAGPNADLIWARGVRNPYTLTFQPATGKLWVNVVGTLYEQIFVVGRGDHAGYNLYENNQPAGFITPVIKYRTNGLETFTIAAGGAVRAGGVTTFTTTGNNNVRAGERITVAGVADPSFNGSFFVRSAPAPATFTVVQGGPDATSDGGTATTLSIGGCVTGGTFYDSSEGALAYRGNFFFGDYNSGRLLRVTLDPASNGVTSVDTFATGVTGAIDLALGPDGALYYTATVGGNVMRIGFNATMPGLVVSPSHLWFDEGDSGVVSVRLATAPTAPVTVTAWRGAGDVDIDVQAGARLTFTPENWNKPQTVTVAAAPDVDGLDDVSTLTVASPGLSSETVAVHAHDENAAGLVLSPSALTLDEAKSANFTVVLTRAPAADLVVASAVAAGGDADVTITAGASLTFTAANWNVPQVVTVSAKDDADLTDDVASVAVLAPGYPPRSVAVAVRDDDPRAPAFSSTPALTARPGLAYRYPVTVVGNPPAVVSLEAAPAGMSIDAAGVITWTPVAEGTFEVTVRASNGLPRDALQTYSLVVMAPAPDAAPPDAGAPDGAVVADAAVPDAPSPDAAATADARRDAVAMDDSGCSCQTGGRPRGGGALLLLGLAVAVGWSCQRRRRLAG
jgi:MYXO-CTERM domain-containing protein